MELVKFAVYFVGFLVWFSLCFAAGYAATMYVCKKISRRFGA
jgi:membrane protein DedA with SNARE-associated domain